MEKYGFIYIWYDRKRKMYYIGSHWGHENDGYICSSNRMRDAYRRRPRDFKRRILERVHSNRLVMLEHEEQWLLKISDNEIGKKYYNLTRNTKGTYWWGDETKNMKVSQKISRALKGKPGSWLGKNHSVETKEKLRQKATGRKHTDGAKEKMRVAQRGNTNCIGRKLSEESKEKMRQAKLGRKLSEEHRAKLSAAHKGRKLSEAHVEKMRGRKMTEENKKKLREVHLGKTVSKETREKISMARKGKFFKGFHGRKHTEETKEKMRQAKLARKRKLEETVVID